jgi:DNA-binding transcriptional ArsR family regulator
MVDNQAYELDAVFHALADPTRRAMLARLAGGARSVGELAQPFPMSLAAAAKHIQVLERAGLVRREVLGRSHRCHLEAAALHAGAEWLRHYQRFWSERLDALERELLATGDTTGDQRATGPPEPEALPPARRPRPSRTRTRPP